MDAYQLIMLFHSHVRTYTGLNPVTGVEWTTGERMADIFRQIRKAAVVREFVDGAYTDADDAARSEVKAELGIE